MAPPSGGIAESQTVCQLLGNGDPVLAWSQLQHLALGVEWSKDIEAACYSLGFASTGSTHLARLEEFAAELYIDQRQARRYSDRGLVQLTRLICTNWVTYSVPTFDMVITPSSSSTVVLYFQCCRPEVVRMAVPTVRSRNAVGEKVFDFTTTEWRDGPMICVRVEQPLTADLQGETSITASWSGELWPKFSVRMAGHTPHVTEIVECLGAKMVVRLLEA